MRSKQIAKGGTSFLASVIVSFSSLLAYFRAAVYDALILHMTTRWYAAVLQRLPKHSRVLDVGIGTAGALINCSELVKERDLKIVGIDYDAAYVTQATRAVKKAGLQDSIQVYQKSVYDLSTEDGTFDAVYFSGSFTLLPDPCEALRVVRALTKHRVFITQTYQRKSPPLLGYIKPLLKYITTIDFGKLMTEEESLDLFAHIIPKECHMRLVQHEVIQGSIDTYLQAAYLSILEPVL